MSRIYKLLSLLVAFFLIALFAVAQQPSDPQQPTALEVK